MGKKFIGEVIESEGSTFDTARMAMGEPGLPMRFIWRGNPIRVVRVLRSWRETGPCRHGSGERYVRKHWYEVLTDSGSTMTIYFERQARSRSQRKKRWWLHTEESEEKDKNAVPGDA